MRKLSEVIYNKLFLQAEEAKELKFDKLANGIMQAIGPIPTDEVDEFSYDDLKKEVYNCLWDITISVVNYYDLESADVSKVDSVLEDLSTKFIKEIKETLNVSDGIGPKEPKVPGEDI